MLLDLVEKFKGPSNGDSHGGASAAGKSTPVTAPAVSNQAPAAAPPAASAALRAESQFSSPAPRETASHSVLGRHVEIKGSIRFSQDLLIDGQVEGDICSDGVLTVGAHAVIKGEIKTGSVIILGNVEGNIATQDRCELTATASLVGDISAGRLVIEEGATFIGRSQISKRQSGNKAAPEQAAKPVEALHATPAQHAAEGMRKAA
jgi:cytoskeletal protein CcmA (bactofilin family)